MIEKQLIKALEPFIDDLVALEKRLDEVAKLEGPQGPTGEQGAPGADAVAPEAAEIVEVFKSDEAFIDSLRGLQGETGERGADGQDAVVDYDAIVKSVVLTEEFTETNIEAIKSMMAAKFEEEMNEVETILYG